jgi:hypothetical protein
MHETASISLHQYWQPAFDADMARGVTVYVLPPSLLPPDESESHIGDRELDAVALEYFDIRRWWIRYGSVRPKNSARGR